MTERRLILASSSPQRRELLTAAGYSFEVIAPNASVECGVCSSQGPAALVAELAFKKAADVRPQVRAGTIVACDSVVACRGRILGKPRDKDDARAMLTSLNGTEHRVFSGLCVWHSSDGSDTTGEVDGAAGESRGAAPDVEVAVTVLRMDQLTKKQLEEYLESGGWEGKAGGFGYQDRLGWVHVVEGSESNVIGLPLELLDVMLKRIRDVTS